jgi:hypothetical protein
VLTGKPPSVSFWLVEIYSVLMEPFSQSNAANPLLTFFALICRNPGALPDWLGNVVVSVAIAMIICFMFVYLLSYVHISGKFTYMVKAAPF